MESSAGKTVIMYQAFGIPEAYNQVIFSILSLYYHLNGNFNKIHPVVYTDNSQIFNKYLSGMPLTILPLTPADIKAYFGPAHYLHRLRHCILKDCFERFKSNILYVDGDTFYLQSPEALLEQITPEQSVMHVKEFDMQEAGDFEGLPWLRLRKVIRENTFTRRGISYKIPYSTVMWNAGVLGIDYNNRDIIDDTIELMDQMFPKGRIFNTEQLAIGYFIQNRTIITPADEVIFHYWPGDLKNAYNLFIRKFLAGAGNSPLPQLAAKAYEASKQKDKLPLIEPSFWDRLKLRLSLVKKVALKGSL